MKYVSDAVYQKIEFSVFNDTGMDLVLFKSGGHFVGDTTNVNLPNGVWTTISIVMEGSSIQNRTIWIYTGDWYKGIYAGDIYFSALRGEEVELGSKFVNLTENNYSAKIKADGYNNREEGHGDLSYNDTYGFGGEDSVKLVARSFYTDVVLYDSKSLSDCKQIRFAVYNDNNAKYVLVYNGQQFTLTQKSWTIITIDVTKETSLNGFKFRIYDGAGYGGMNGRVFYISDIYVTRDDTQSDIYAETDDQGQWKDAWRKKED